MADGIVRHFSCFRILLWLLQTSSLSYGDQKLRMVNVVYRHGDRSPAHFFPTDKHKNYWPQGPGQLTQIGMEQEYELGQLLKDLYVKKHKLLNSTYLFKEIYVRSSDRDRCIMSAETQLNGLYPPEGKQIWRDHLDWQPIGVHVVPIKDDYLLRPFDHNCPRLSELRKKSKQDKDYLDMIKQNKEVLLYVSKHAQMKATLGNAWKIYDTLFCEKSHNLTLPAWATNGTTWEALRNISNFAMMSLFNSPEKAKLTGGNLVGAIVNNMKDHLKPTSKKMYIYSAHDITVTALLSALKIFDGISPAYSSAVMIELFSDENDNNKNLMVRIMYRYGQSKPRVLKIAQCTEFCALDDFIECYAWTYPPFGGNKVKAIQRKTADVVPEDIVKACGVEQEKCIRTVIYKSFMAAFVAVTVLLVLILMCLSIRCCRQRYCRRNNLTVYNDDLLRDARLLDRPDYDSDT